MIKTPLKKIEKNPSTAFLFLFLIVLSYLLVWFFIVSDIEINEQMLSFIHGSFAISVVFFLLSWLRDPGYIEKD